MKWWVFILLPFSLLAQETYTNCEDLKPQSYQVDYDANKLYYWSVSNGEIKINNSNSITVQWPDSVGIYVVSVYTTKFNCEGDTSYKEIEIKECPYTQLFFPNAFSPNGDGINDTYKVYGRTANKIEHILIYNRWGERVFEANKNTFWNGKNCQTGLYTISVFVNENRYIKSIMLIR